MKLLIEIGTEELPAIPFLKELDNIPQKWHKILEKYRLKSEFEFKYSPRRLVFLHDNFNDIQQDITQVITGAPKSVAIKNGEFTQAALSFAKKCEIELDNLCFKEVDGKEVLYFEKYIAGRNCREILQDMLEEFLASLNFGKSMRWGANTFSFIRPVRSIVCMIDDELVDINLYGVKSSKSFFPHRYFGYEKIKFKDIKDYFIKLKEYGVILDSNQRRDKILKEFDDISKRYFIDIEIDENLLDEVVCITEYPTALIGSFDEEFLNIPSEAIITSMKENQRYFPVFKNSKLSNKFVFVSNSLSDNNNLIIKGNQKVLRARLSDAKFFWDSDLKSKLDYEKLKNVVFLNEIGTVYDKELSECKVVDILFKYYKNKILKFVKCDEIKALQNLKRAIMLSKADLVTSMVSEFTNLQGVMGYYYAKNAKEDDLVCTAIAEQYLPAGENSTLPSNIFSCMVCMSIKLDTLMSLFSIGKIPTGNKDPYALRRAANGILTIVLKNNLNFDIAKIIKELSGNYRHFDLSILENFILERLYTIYDVNPSVIKACINSGQRDLFSLNSSILALKDIVSKEQFYIYFDTFKRLSNMIKEQNVIQDSVKPELFENEYEHNLFAKFIKAKDTDDIRQYLNNLFELKDDIDKFFETTMINVENKDIKSNRMALIGNIYNAFLKIADIKEIKG